MSYMKAAFSWYLVQFVCLFGCLFIHLAHQVQLQ